MKKLGCLWGWWIISLLSQHSVMDSEVMVKIRHLGGWWIVLRRLQDSICSRKKCRFLQLFLRILSSLKIFKSCQSKSIYLLNWTQLISADLSFHILGILLNVNLGGFGFNVSFSKRAVQMFVRNIG